MDHWPEPLDICGERRQMHHAVEAREGRSGRQGGREVMTRVATRSADVY